MTFTKQTFDAVKNKTFKIEFESNQPLDFELIEVNGINSHTIKEGQTEPFPLIFQSTDKRIFEQNTYKLNPKELKEIKLFLVPIEADDNVVIY